MARIRTVKPEFWMDEELAEVSEPACLMAIGLLNHADDEGYFKANPGLVRAAVFPLREPSETIPGMLRELSEIGYIDLFQGSDGKEYGHIRNFSQHQTISKAKASKIRELRAVPEQSGSDPGTVLSGKERKGKEYSNSNNGASARELTILPGEPGYQPPDEPRRRIPLDFKPTDSDMTMLMDKHIPVEFINDQVAEFVMYWDERKSERNDWRARFRTRCIKVWLESQGSTNSPTGGRDGADQRGDRKDWSRDQIDEGILGHLDDKAVAGG